MAENLTPIKSNELAKVSALSNTDLITLGIGNDFKTITVGNLKEALGINALNTNLTKLKKIETIYNTAISCIKLNEWKWTSLPTLSNYDIVVVYYSIADGKRDWTLFFRNYAPLFHGDAYPSPTYNAHMAIQMDFSGNRIGVMCSRCVGWTINQITVNYIMGLRSV